MKRIYLYHLQQDDEVKYVGLTINKRVRMKWHKRDKPEHKFIIKDHYYNDKLAAIGEIKHIEKYKTFYNGWNKTKGGENYCMGLVDRKGIGGVTKGTTPWNKGKKNCFTEETIERFRKVRKGKIHSSKLNEQTVTEIRNLFNQKPKVNFEVGKVMRNGKEMSYEQAFSKTYYQKYNLTPEGLKKVVTKQSWTNVKS
jgi:hypothetical protein